MFAEHLVDAGLIGDQPGFFRDVAANDRLNVGQII